MFHRPGEWNEKKGTSVTYAIKNNQLQPKTRIPPQYRDSIERILGHLDRLDLPANFIFEGVLDNHQLLFHEAYPTKPLPHDLRMRLRSKNPTEYYAQFNRHYSREGD